MVSIEVTPDDYDRFFNLISNAVKFTEEGEVQTAVRVIDETDDGVKLQFTVSDTGIGISSEMREKIFDAFRQADGSTTRRYGGTGLGLSISRQLTEMMNGDMWVESTQGEGSQFHFTAVLEKEDGELQSHAEELSRRSLLVIVPNDFARSAIEEYAAQMKINVTAVQSEAEAQSALSEHEPFDLILLDLNLKDGDALDLVQDIHSSMDHAQTKIVLLTTHRMKVDPGMMRTLGVSGTLLKPVRLNRLHQALLNALTGKVHKPKTYNSNSLNQHNSLRILVAEDNPINQRVATLQLTKLGHQVGYGSVIQCDWPRLEEHVARPLLRSLGGVRIRPFRVPDGRPQSWRDPECHSGFPARHRHSFGRCLHIPAVPPRDQSRAADRSCR